MEQQKKEKKKVVMPYGLRNKLMAAVAMLLVSSIMMVSSTFAWFTLSTAPEIKGISTSVGANGNLEMALLTSGDTDAKIEDTFKDLTKITSAVGDSSAANKDITKSNITWGNLVQLSETEKDPYGLSEIQLMPARLQTTDAKTLTVGSPLLTPTYGTDGRVATVAGRTIFSANYTEAGDFEFKEDSLTYGVRAVGESATLTPQAKGLMSAKADYTTNLNKARSTVQASLKANMQGLANAALALVNGGPVAEKDQGNISALLSSMSTALDQIDMAYGDVVRAFVASQVKDAKTYEAVMSVLSGAKYSDMVDENTNLKTPAGKTLPIGVDLPPVSLTSTKVAAAASELVKQKKAVTDAQAAINNNGNPNYSTAVNALANTEYMDINGLSLKRPTDDTEVEGSVWMKDNDGYKVDQNALAGSVLSKGVTINMADGSGLFAYIATVNTNYSASDYIGMSFAGLTVEKNDTSDGVLVTMNTTVKTFDTTVTNEITQEKSDVTVGVTLLASLGIETPEALDITLAVEELNDTPITEPENGSVEGVDMADTAEVPQDDTLDAAPKTKMVTYRGIAEEIPEGSALWYSFGPGWCYRFCPVTSVQSTVDGQAGEIQEQVGPEVTWTVKAGERWQKTITVAVRADADVRYDALLRLCADVRGEKGNE